MEKVHGHEAVEACCSNKPGVLGPFWLKQFKRLGVFVQDST